MCSVSCWVWVLGVALIAAVAGLLGVLLVDLLLVCCWFSVVVWLI